MNKRYISGLIMVTGFLFFVGKAQAEVDLDLSGRFLGYGLYNDQDTAAGASLRHFDFRKETTIDIEGTTTLDNGLKVGFATELDLDRPDSEGFIDTSFATVSSGFGEVYFGENDGIASILQVEAPAADPYVDGIDPKINAFDISELGGGDAIPDALGYLQEPIGKATKIGYTTPYIYGLQVGISYAPTVDDADLASAQAAAPDNETGEAQNGLEAALRFEKDMLGSKVILGAGVSHADMEAKEAIRTQAGSDDRLAYNTGMQIGYGKWTAGAAAVYDNNAIKQNGDTRIYVVGINYDVMDDLTLGASYYDRNDEAGFTEITEVDTRRIAAGVAYDYADGLILRGSVSHVNVDNGVAEDDGVQVAMGTELSF